MSPSPSSTDLEPIVTVEPVEVERGEPAVFLADPDRLAELIDDDEDGSKFKWDSVRVCPACGALAAGDRGSNIYEPVHDRRSRVSRCSPPLTTCTARRAAT